MLLTYSQLLTLRQNRPIIVVVLDSRRAALHRYHGGQLEHIKTVQARLRSGHADHPGAPARREFHTGTPGATAAESSEVARLSARDKMIEALLRRLIAMADREGGVIVGGMPEAAAAAVEVFGPTFPGRVLLASDLHLRATEAEIINAAEHGATTLRNARDDLTVTRLLDLARAHQRGVVGPDATLAALAANAGRELLLTRTFLDQHPGIAEAAVEKALEQHATIDVVSGPAAARIDAVGGVGLLLRFFAHEAVGGAASGRGRSARAGRAQAAGGGNA